MDRMATFEVGDAVDYCAVIGGPATSHDHVIKAIEHAPNNYGCDVAWISGKSGCVALSTLRRAGPPDSAWTPPPKREDR